MMYWRVWRSCVKDCRSGIKGSAFGSCGCCGGVLVWFLKVWSLERRALMLWMECGVKVMLMRGGIVWLVFSGWCGV